MTHKTRILRGSNFGSWQILVLWNSNFCIILWSPVQNRTTYLAKGIYTESEKCLAHNSAKQTDWSQKRVSSTRVDFSFYWIGQWKLGFFISVGNSMKTGEFFNPLTLLCAGGLQRRFWRQLIVWFGSGGGSCCCFKQRHTEFEELQYIM